ncbi:MAG: DUF3990 domain-containing protein [Clostridiales bacterium]|nr:DUF3990 domain-containing protein [Clostridiales bacterium]
MIVYHGSYIEMLKPDTAHSRSKVDFGKGFYTTPLLEQAESWSLKFKGQGKKGIISSYIFDEKAFSELNVLRFNSYCEEWLDFIILCRSGNDNTSYDIVTGGVANDKVFNTLELYFDGLIDKKEAIKRLKYEKPNMQICFRSQKAIDKYLHFKESKSL